MLKGLKQTIQILGPTCSNSLNLMEICYLIQNVSCYTHVSPMPNWAQWKGITQNSLGLWTPKDNDAFQWHEAKLTEEIEHRSSVLWTEHFGNSNDFLVMNPYSNLKYNIWPPWSRTCTGIQHRRRGLVNIDGLRLHTNKQQWSA